MVHDGVLLLNGDVCIHEMRHADTSRRGIAKRDKVFRVKHPDEMRIIGQDQRVRPREHGSVL